MKLKTKVIAGVIGVLTLAGFGTFVLNMTMGVSILDTVLYAMETEEAQTVEETAETEEPSEDEKPTVEIKQDGLDKDTYYKAYSIDYSEVPEDIRITGDVLSYEGWSAKSFALAYLLAAEICTRPEINPPGTDVIIKPEHLIGEWASEGGFRGSPEAEDLIPKRDYCTWISQSNNWSQDAVGPFGQMYYYYSGNDSAVGCIYISRLENPSLAEEKRAVMGERSAIYSGNGKYITEGLWTSGMESLNSASTSELSTNIKQGTFDSSSIGYKARPACYYLPDAMYSHALGLRSGLYGKSYNETINGYNKDHNLATIKSLAVARTEKCSDAVYADIMMCMTYGQYVGTNWDDYINTSSGMIGKLYKHMVKYGISPKNDAVFHLYGNTLMQTGPGNFGATLATGIEASTALPQMQNIFTQLGLIEEASGPSVGAEHYAMNLKDSIDYSGRDDLSKSLTTGVLWQIKSKLIAKGYDEGSQLFQTFSSEFDTFCAGHSISDYSDSNNYRTYPFYGITCLNSAYVIEPTLVSSVNEVFNLYGDMSLYRKLTKDEDIEEGAIDGVTCLGDGCYHDKVHTKRLTTESIMSSLSASEKANYILERDIPFNKTKQSYIDQSTVLDVLNLNIAKKVTVSQGSLADTTSYGNELRENIFTGLSLPMPGNLSYGSYPGHAGIDIIASDNNGIGITYRNEVHPVAPGIIIGINEFPYSNLGTNFPTYGMNGYGNLIIILHKASDGTYFYSLYAHLDSFAHIKLGSAVSSDTVIGYADSTGKSTGDHLHLELRIMSATPSGKFSYSGNIYTTPNYIAKSLAGDDYAAY